MNTNKIAKKRSYNCPEIVCIQLDNEISLALESSPPNGPDESNNLKQNNPFKEQAGLT